MKRIRWTALTLLAVAMTASAAEEGWRYGTGQALTGGGWHYGSFAYDAEDAPASPALPAIHYYRSTGQ